MKQLYSFLPRIQKLFFFLFLLFLPTQLGRHFWPSWSMILGRRVDFLSPTLYTTDLLLIGLFFSWTLTHKRFELSMNFRRMVLGSSFLLLFVCTTCFAVVPIIAIFGWFVWIKTIFLVYFISTTKPSFKTISLPLVIGAVASTGLAFAQIVHHGSLNGMFWFFGERFFIASTPNIANSVLCLPFSSACIEYLRPYATFSHPNILGGFLGFVLILLIPRIKTASGIEKLSLLILTIGLVTTLSRSAWMGLTICLIAIAKIHNRFIKVLVLGVSLVIFFFLLSPFSDQNETIMVRNQLNSAAIKMILDHLWVGVGMNNFLVALPHYLPFRTVYFLQPAHNIYLLLLSEVGFVGLGLIIILLFPLVKRLYKTLSSQSAYLPSLLPLLFILIVGLFDHYFFTIQQGQLLFALSIGIAIKELP